MTINDAIAKCDNTYPNTIVRSEKVFLLSQLDGMIEAEIYEKYEDNEAEGFSGYTDDTSGDTELLIPYPYDSIYISWLVAHMYLLMEEIDKYNNWMTMYNGKLDAYERYYAQYHDQKAPIEFTYF